VFHAALEQRFLLGLSGIMSRITCAAAVELRSPSSPPSSRIHTIAGYERLEPPPFVPVEVHVALLSMFDGMLASLIGGRK
jgi:hypothetical protein